MRQPSKSWKTPHVNERTYQMYYMYYIFCIPSSNHGTIIRTRITCKKIPCYMRDSACRWFIVENVKIFRSYVKRFEFSHVKEIVES